MQATAIRDTEGKVTVMLKCDNDTDERIIIAMANSTWVGQAIRQTFGDWRCPFYDALKDVVNFSARQVDVDTTNLKADLHLHTS